MQLGLVVGLGVAMDWARLVLGLVAIVAIAYLERLAILSGIDGWLLALALAAIAGLGGYELKGWREKRGSK